MKVGKMKNSLVAAIIVTISLAACAQSTPQGASISTAVPVALATPTRVEPTSTTVPTVAFTPTPEPTEQPTMVPTAEPTEIQSGPSLVGTLVPGPRDGINATNATNVTELARWDLGYAGPSAYSPDGKLLAVGSGFGVYLYDAETLASRAFWPTTSGVVDPAFDGDGLNLSAALYDKFLRTWEVESGGLVQSQVLPMNFYNTICFSTDGALAAIVNEDDEVQLIQVSDGASLGVMNDSKAPVATLALSFDKTRVAQKRPDGTLNVWDVSNGQPLLRLQVGGPTGEIKFSPDGAVLARGSGSSVYLLSAADGSLVRELAGQGANVGQMSFSPDGPYLASVSADATVTLWRVADDTLVGHLEGHTAAIRMVSFAPDGAQLASTSNDGTVRIWDTKSGSQMALVSGHDPSALSLDLSSDGEMLAVGRTDSSVRLMRAEDGTERAVVRTGTDYPVLVSFSADDSVLLTGSFEPLVRLWRVSDASLLESVESHVGSTVLPNAKISASGIVATWLPVGTVKLWSASNGAALADLIGHTSRVISASFSPDGRFLATGALDQSIRLWQTDGGTLVWAIDGLDAPATAVEFTPDGSAVAAGIGNEIHLLRVEDGSVTATLAGNSDGARAISFSPDGSVLLAISGDGMARLWSPNDARLIASLDGFSTRIVRTAFSPDGSILATGTDGDLRLWHASEGGLLASLEGHTSLVYGLEFSPDGSRLYSASDDGTIRVWGISE